MELRSLTFPRGPVFDADGELAVGHALACYYPGTDTLRTWYADADLTTPAPNPDLVGSDGRIAQKFLGPGPSEIRQYSPVSPSSVIPDDLQDFPGSEWALEWSWLEDGVSPSPDAAVLIVDTVDDLRALEDEDAKKGLVAVRGYYAAADKIGVRFYQYKSASSPSDDGGAVLGSAMGGRWLLKVQTADVDVRWWGALPDTAEDRSTAIAAAAAWTSANGVTLWFPAGCYQVAGGSVSLGPVRLDEGVTFNATDSIYAMTLTSTWEIGGTSALKDASSSSAVQIVMAETAAPGTCYQAWGGGTASGYGFKGHDVVLTGDRLNMGSTGALKSVRVGSNDAVLSVTTSGGTIEMLVSDGGGASVIGAVGETVTIGTAYASAFKAGEGPDVADHCVIGTLVLDVDIAFTGKDVSFGTIVAAGGKVTAANSLTCSALVKQGSLPCFGADFAVEGQNGDAIEGLTLDAFSAPAVNAVASVAKSNAGVVDLLGKTISLGDWLPTEVRVLRNGSIDVYGFTIAPGAELYVDHATLTTDAGASSIGENASLRLLDSTLDLSAVSQLIFSFVGGEVSALRSVIKCAHFTSSYSGGSGAPVEIDFEDCDLGDGDVMFTSCSIHAHRCNFAGRVAIRGRIGDFVVVGCSSDYNPQDGQYDIIDFDQARMGFNYAQYPTISGKIDVRNNRPDAVAYELMKTSARWQQTEGRIFVNDPGNTVGNPPSQSFAVVGPGVFNVVHWVVPGSTYALHLPDVCALATSNGNSYSPLETRSSLTQVGYGFGIGVESSSNYTSPICISFRCCDLSSLTP